MCLNVYHTYICLPYVIFKETVTSDTSIQLIDEKVADFSVNESLEVMILVSFICMLHARIYKIYIY